MIIDQHRLEPGDQPVPFSLESHVHIMDVLERSCTLGFSGTLKNPHGTVIRTAALRLRNTDAAGQR
jgi:hypothetical protein